MNAVVIQKYKNPLLIAILCILTISAYWPVRHYPFISLDDGEYIYENHHVPKGITLDNIRWAFSMSPSGAGGEKGQPDYWHPLTWLSHMLDCQIYGLNPHGHHLTNLFFHVVNAVLLFLVLVKMTGEAGKSFFVAALFALHPISVDSAAWIAERKNLLSTSFWMMTMLAYVYYARQPSVSRYLSVFACLALGLLAKPMLVTLPCVLLLTDYWPLDRLEWGRGVNPKPKRPEGAPPRPAFSRASAARLIWEKIPLLALSAAAIPLSLTMLQGKSQVLSEASVPMPIRIENAFVSYIAYLYEAVWPQKLAVFYPFPKFIPWWQTAGAVVLLAAATALVVIGLKRKPYLATGWFWYLGVLFPVIGLVQGGLWPARADRWAYVPMIGIFMIIAWGVPDLVPRRRDKNHFLSVSASAVILLLFLATRVQLGYWKDTDTLFRHALDVTQNNFLAYQAVGQEYAKKGNVEKAEQYLLRSIEIKPDQVDTLKALGTLYQKIGDYEKALEYFNDAWMYSFSDAEIMRDIADTLRLSGKAGQAIEYYSQAMQIKPFDPVIHNNLGNALFITGEIGKAEQEFKTALTLNPHYADACYNLGLVAMKTGHPQEAIQFYQRAVEIDPDHADAHTSLADLLFAQGDLRRALHHYTESLRIRPGNPVIHYNAGVVLLMLNRPEEALKRFQEALALNPDYEKAKKAVALIKTRSIQGMSGER